MGRAARSLRALVVLLHLGVAATLPSQGTASGATLTFEPREWRMGEVPGDTARTLSVTVANSGDRSATVSFIPTCDCLTSTPVTAEIAAGESASFRLAFDARGYNGAVVLDFLVRTDVPGIEKALFAVAATVAGQAADRSTASTAAAGDTISLPLYASAGCRACDRLVAELEGTLTRALGRPVTLELKNILEPAMYEEYTAILARLGQTERAYPALVVGTSVLQGDWEIRENARQRVLEGGEPVRTASGGGADLRVLPIAAAGLLDGVNPCAFSTLVFLVSSLVVAGRGRRQVLAVGGLFAVGVFVTYYAIGLGAFGALRAAAAFPIVAVALRWVLFAALLVLAGLSMFDYFAARRGDPARVLLQLPGALKQRIHTTIRGGSRAAVLGFSAAAMGVVVSVFELACTGQVYLPAIAYMVRSGAGGSAYLYLLVYNLGFIAPLVVVFVLAWLGLTSRRLADIVRSSIGVVKLGLAGLFVVLAILTALT